jgi:protein SCO1/2
VNPRIVLALLMVGVFALGGIVFAATRDDDPAPSAAKGPLRFAGSTLPGGVKAPGFDLTDERGKRIRMSDFRGRPVLVTFLYTTCKDTCPAQAQTAKGALNDLGEDIPTIAIAVDPANDTERNAQAFLLKQRMNERMRFVLGSRPRLAPLWRSYHVQPQSITNEHSGRFVLVDPRGFQRVAFPLEKATPEALAHDLRILAAGR